MSENSKLELSTSAAKTGMAWYNGCSEAERARWHAVAGSAVPADAYRAFCGQAASAAVAPQGEYPPLPAPYINAHEDAGAEYPDTFVASQMHGYYDLGRRQHAAVAGPSDDALRIAVDHAHEILRRLMYHRDGDFFINVNRRGAEALHISTIATIVHAALAAAPTEAAFSWSKT